MPFFKNLLPALTIAILYTSASAFAQRFEAEYWTTHGYGSRTYSQGVRYISPHPSGDSYAKVTFTRISEFDGDDRRYSIGFGQCSIGGSLAKLILEGGNELSAIVTINRQSHELPVLNRGHFRNLYAATFSCDPIRPISGTFVLRLNNSTIIGNNGKPFLFNLPSL